LDGIVAEMSGTLSVTRALIEGSDVGVTSKGTTTMNLAHATSRAHAPKIFSINSVHMFALDASQVALRYGRFEGDGDHGVYLEGTDVHFDAADLSIQGLGFGLASGNDVTATLERIAISGASPTGLAFGDFNHVVAHDVTI